MEMSKTFNNIRAYASRNRLPLIPIESKNVSLIERPNLFYQTLLDKIKSTEHRLALSALYIGTGTKEGALVQAIYDNLKSNSHLDVNIVLDHNRSSRVDARGQSSIDFLDKLSRANAKLNLFKATTGKYRRWNEMISTYHAKFMIFDKDIIFTGANLSSIYFERRQDRYMLFKKSNLLADYMYNFLQQINSNRNSLGSLKNSIKNYNDNFIEQQEKEKQSLGANGLDSYVLPLVNYGPAGINDSEDFLKFLNSILPENAQVHVSTGYFNPSSAIDSLKIDSFLVPSEEANGFYEGEGFLKYVPRIYSAIQRKFIERHRECKLFLYSKLGWSFHAKGIWVEGLEDIYIHIIGSSNFNYRSSNRDFETQLVILTKDKRLIDELSQERARLWDDAIQIQGPQDLRGQNYIYSSLRNLLKTLL